jgi:GrpB-like predicted nucleotidyltransferase (UPF0157 family)
VVLSESRPEWPRDFEQMAQILASTFGDLALRVDHIGSTSVPGLPAKDVIDAQVVVRHLDNDRIMAAMNSVGYQQRTAAWNLRDHTPAGWSGAPNQWSKLVFVPPAQERDGNVHVRVAGAANERYSLLFRDFLRADGAARTAWARFKTQVALNTQTLSEYGGIKDPATDLLMSLAEHWAHENDWSVPQP